MIRNLLIVTGAGVVLAIVAGADLGFVVVHHLARLTLVILGAPIFAAVMGLRKKRDRRPE